MRKLFRVELGIILSLLGGSVWPPCLNNLSAKTQLPSLLAFALSRQPEEKHAEANTAVQAFANGSLTLPDKSVFFEANHGQVPAETKFLVKGLNHQIWLTDSGLIWEPKPKSKTGKSANALLAMRLLNSNSQVVAEGLDQLTGRINYLRGQDQSQWKTDIPTYARTLYREVYPGINLLYYFNERGLEYDFIVSPGADVSRIKIAFEGKRKLRIEKSGDLVIETKHGELRQHRPIAYQNIGSTRRAVAAQFRQNAKGEISFAVEEYDSTQPLIIDPSLSFSSYLGGSNLDAGHSIAVDAEGNIYVAGNANSSDFPVSASAYQKSQRNGDIFVTKLSPAGNAIIYSTFIGGSNVENLSGIALDSGNNLVLTGMTTSADFPTTPGAYQGNVKDADAFIAKLNSTGSGLIYSTLLGGTGNDVANGITIDSAGNAYLTGYTTSTDFPVTAGVFQSSAQGGSLDAFITKLNATGTQLVYSSYLGGSGIDIGAGVAVDSTGNAYLAGHTASANFPTTAGVFQPSFKGGANLSDGFVAKVNATGSALIYSTYLGGTADDVVNGIAIDASGNAYVAGTTTGATNDFPTTAGAFQTTYKGSSIPGPVSDAFISKLNSAGTALTYSTYLGGNGADKAFGIAVNAQGTAVVTGSTSSSNFPVNADGFNVYAGSVDAYVVQLDAAGATLPYAAYLGGARNDIGVGIALDNLGSIYVAGYTSSPNFPVFPSALRANNAGGQDAFFAAIKNGVNRVAATVMAGSYRAIPTARESIVSAFGERLATRTESSNDIDPNTPGIQLPTTLGGTTVKIKDAQGIERLAPLFFVSPTQVNYQIPPVTPVGSALVTATAEDGTISIGTIQIVDVAPDVFSADSTGKGPAIGNAVRVKSTGAQSEEPIVRYNVNKWELIPLDLGPETEQVFLILYGTGVRFRKDPPQVSATIGGVAARVDYAKNQCCFVGLDQINLLIPRSLIGRGEVDVVLTVEGQATLPLKIAIK